MQNPVQKSWQSSLVVETPGILSENLKILTLELELTTLQFNIFCWNFAHVPYLLMSTKGCVGFFLFFLDLELFAKVKNNRVSTHSFFTLLLITQDKKSHTPFCRYYSVENVCKISVKNIKLYGGWSWSKFSFFSQKTWFLGNNWRLF